MSHLSSIVLTMFVLARSLNASKQNLKKEIKKVVFHKQKNSASSKQAPDTWYRQVSELFPSLFPGSPKNVSYRMLS